MTVTIRNVADYLADMLMLPVTDLAEVFETDADYIEILAEKTGLLIDGDTVELGTDDPDDFCAGAAAKGWDPDTPLVFSEAGGKKFVQVRDAPNQTTLPEPEPELATDEDLAVAVKEAAQAATPDPVEPDDPTVKMEADTPDTDLAAEVERLRARVAQLEAELATRPAPSRGVPRNGQRGRKKLMSDTAVYWMREKIDGGARATLFQSFFNVSRGVIGRVRHNAQRPIPEDFTPDAAEIADLESRWEALRAAAAAKVDA